MRTTKYVRSVFLFLLAAICSATLAQVSAEQCGELRSSHFGPFDFRADKDIKAPGDNLPHQEKRRLVEGAHFTLRVETLRGAQSGGQIGPPGGDLNYTLKSFPNHHRALISVMNYGIKTKSSKPPGLQWEVECYFERALRFRNNDAIVHMIYATYLDKQNRQPEAVGQLERATAIAADNPFTHYNIGLVYFDMKMYDKALAQAHKAIALDFERTELRDSLAKIGQWQDPPPKVESK